MRVSVDLYGYAIRQQKTPRARAGRNEGQRARLALGPVGALGNYYQGVRVHGTNRRPSPPPVSSRGHRVSSMWTPRVARHAGATVGAAAGQVRKLSLMTNASASGNAFVSENPGRDAQRIGTARFLGQPPEKIHEPVWAVLGTLGDSQCYLGVRDKVQAVFTAMSNRIADDDLKVRLIAPGFTMGVSDGQLNGTDRMRYSLLGRELVNDLTDMHLRANAVAGFVGVVACDKPPVGTVAALLEHNVPSVILSDGSVHPGRDPETGAPLDIISGFQVAGDPDDGTRTRVAMHACPGQGSCAGMFTYNTMQTFIGVLGLEPLHMVSPASDDPRRTKEFPAELVSCLVHMTQKGIRPRDIVTPASLRNAVTVVMAMGGSTNVALHVVEIARAAGLDFWTQVMSQKEFNDLSHRLPVVVNMRPFGLYAMLDLDAVGGVQVVVKELLEAGWLDGDTLTCTGETLAEQVARLDPPAPDGKVVLPLSAPYKPTGGLRFLSGNIAPEGGAILKVAGVEGGIVDGRFVGRARVFAREQRLIDALQNDPDSFNDGDVVIIRYEGPRGGPGMPEMLDPTSRMTALCRQRNMTIALMTDARFSGGSVGLVIGHVGPEAFLGGPIALICDGDTIVIDLNTDSLDCEELKDPATFEARRAAWQAAVDANGGTHPGAVAVPTRTLGRMRASAQSALKGAGMNDG
jgi:dihydroxy-acid dehydratase